MTYSIETAKYLIKEFKYLIGRTFTDPETYRKIEIQYIAIVPIDEITQFFSKCNFVNDRERFIQDYPIGNENLAVLLIGYTLLNRRWYIHLDDYLKTSIPA